MDIGLNNYLKKLSSELFIKYDSDERKRIDKSIDNILTNLKEYFADSVDKVIVFGSYSRDTILPRRYDVNSDIDILVQFNTTKYDKLKPESYRNQLKVFAEKKYRNSLSLKDHPSIVLELQHIKFDLVPAIFDVGVFYDSLEIPDGQIGWMETEPDKFSKELSNVNSQFNSIVKPIIRLVKAWNASRNYPYYSFYLEKSVADMNFKGDNFESGFFYAVENLPTSDLPDQAIKKVESLRKKVEWIKEYLSRGNLEKAKEVVNRIIPQ